MNDVTRNIDPDFPTGSATFRQSEANDPRAIPMAPRIALGGDKDFVGELREGEVAPHIAIDAHLTKTGKARKTRTDAGTTRHSGYVISQRIRERIEAGFSYLKTVAVPRKIKASRGGDGWPDVRTRRDRLQPDASPETHGGHVMISCHTRDDPGEELS